MKWLALLLVPAIASGQEVKVTCTSPDGMRGSGVGFVQEYAEYQEEGKLHRIAFILTVDHVTSLAGKVQVEAGEKTYPASIMYIEHDLDMTMLVIAPDTPLKSLKLAMRSFRGQKIRVAGKEGKIMEVSQRKVECKDFVTVNARVLQMTAKVQAGDSGSPIMCDGEVVGIVFARGEDSSLGVDVSEIRAFVRAMWASKGYKP